MFNMFEPAPSHGTKQMWRKRVAFGLFFLAPLSLIGGIYATISALDWDYPGTFAWLLAALILVASVAPPIAGAHLLRSWHNCNEPTAEEALQRDPRPPIIYLRPFIADKLSYDTIESRS